MENKKNVLYICILSFIFWLVKTGPSIRQINFQNVKISENFYHNNYFKIITSSEEDKLPNSIQLLVENQNSENANFIISYYQDSSFTNRKQLSQNFTDKTIMWLNKKQIHK